MKVGDVYVDVFTNTATWPSTKYVSVDVYGLFRRKFSKYLSNPNHQPHLVQGKKLSNSVIVEGFTYKAKLTVRKSFDFYPFKELEIALYQQLGALPEPQLVHRFW